MNKRILLAGLLGGIALFIWGSFSHIVLGLGSVGIKEIPRAQEAMVKSSLRMALPESGFYFFPGMGIPAGASAQEKQAATKLYQEKYRQGPTGILIFHPQGAEVMTPGQLMIQLGLTVVEALIAAWLLSLTNLTTMRTRVGFVVVLGVLIALATNVEYWDWYGFPTNYTLAYMLDKVIGFAVVGLVIAAVTRRRVQVPRLETAKAA
jgi:hypothetical protein